MFMLMRVYCALNLLLIRVNACVLCLYPMILLLTLDPFLLTSAPVGIKHFTISFSSNF